MKMNTLTVSPRTADGKGLARQARRAGTVPAVLYGEKKDSVSVVVDLRNFETIVHGKGGEHSLIDLTVEGQPELNGPVLVKAVQHHPVSDKILSADFLRIQLDKAIQTFVPVKLTGQCVGLVEGGVPDQHLHEVEITALPLAVPEFIEGDITNIRIGDTLMVESLVVPEGVTLLTPIDRPVLGVKAPRVAKGKGGAAAGTSAGEGEGEE
ncbi:MAG: 50S ribosomal protein L25 [Candidatus Hydrogenedens sp.]|nr:50S ribosomal protein L25 [Candidatus Hydrogenedens sp.]